MSVTCCFRTAFRKSKEGYMKLGQHVYPHKFDSSRPLQIKRGTTKVGNKYIYFGQLEEGTSTWDGIGIAVFSDGDIYEGGWKNGCQNEFGRYIYKTRNYYIGEYKDGDRHGQGTYWWANGYKYVGEWKEGNYHGKGTEYTADGQISREGVWEEGKYVGNG